MNFDTLYLIYEILVYVFIYLLFSFILGPIFFKIALPNSWKALKNNKTNDQISQFGFFCLFWPVSFLIVIWDSFWFLFAKTFESIGKLCLFCTKDVNLFSKKY